MVFLKLFTFRLNLRARLARHAVALLRPFLEHVVPLVTALAVEIIDLRHNGYLDWVVREIAGESRRGNSSSGRAGRASRDHRAA
jgi:hypothetical protein